MLLQCILYLQKYVYSLSGRELDDEKINTMGKYSVNMKPEPATGQLSLALSLDNQPGSVQTKSVCQPYAH